MRALSRLLAEVDKVTPTGKGPTLLITPVFTPGLSSPGLLLPAGSHLKVCREREGHEKDR